LGIIERCVPNQVLATVRNVNMVVNDYQVKRVYAAKTGERRSGS